MIKYFRNATREGYDDRIIVIVYHKGNIKYHEVLK